MNPVGLKLFPRTVNEEGVEESCCLLWGKWSDPHLEHDITLRCGKCQKIAPMHGKEFQNVNSLKASHSVVDVDDGKPNHLQVKCTNHKCRVQEIGKIRVLRRGRNAVYGGRGMGVPMLDVEVIGNYKIDQQDVSNDYFNLYCTDEWDNLCFLKQIQESQDQRIIREVDHADLGMATGFKGTWSECPWNSDEHETDGLRVIDEHNSKREGYPPADWRSEEESEEEDEEEEEAKEEDEEEKRGGGVGGAKGGGNGDEDEKDEDEDEKDEDDEDEDEDDDDDDDNGGGGGVEARYQQQGQPVVWGYGNDGYGNIGERWI